jgi:predicted ATPase
MVDLVPELKLIIGDQPPVLELPPQEAQGRFQHVFRRFIGGSDFRRGAGTCLGRFHDAS